MSVLIDADDFPPLLAAVRPFTMVCEESLLELARHVTAVLRLGIPGDFVECGVWRGGASFLMATLLRAAGVRDRRVWLLDSYEGLPAPKGIDGPAATAWARNTKTPGYFDNCSAPLEQVQQSATDLGLDAHTEFVKGWFDETLPAVRQRIGPISILRIDCDWHASVLSCLEHLYDQVSPGGLIVVDDYYSWDGCAIAVHEFLGRRNLSHRVESILGRSTAWGSSVCAVIRKGSTGWRETWGGLYGRDRAIRELHSLIPAVPFILVDENTLEWDKTEVSHAVPFLEKDGVSLGAPDDDGHAVQELRRLRRSGLRFIVFAWPAFWWLEHYGEFQKHLRSTSRLVASNDRLMVFELEPDA